MPVWIVELVTLSGMADAYRQRRLVASRLGIAAGGLLTGRLPSGLLRERFRLKGFELLVPAKGFEPLTP